MTRGTAGRGLACLGAVGLGVAGSAQHGPARLCPAQRGRSWQGLAGGAWLKAGYGPFGHGPVWQSRSGTVGPGLVGLVSVRQGTDGHGRYGGGDAARYGLASRGAAGFGSVPSSEPWGQQRTQGRGQPDEEAIHGTA